MPINKTKNPSIRRMVLLAMFSAIIVILGVTPLGMIPIIPDVMNATTLHIPVIIGAIMLGPLDGAILGGVFGLVSLLTNTFYPKVASFVYTPFYSLPGYEGNFWSLVICFVPRILIGVVAAYLFRLISRWDKTKIVACAVAGVAGSVVNTALVFGGIALFFGNDYAAANGGELFKIIQGLMVAYGIPEAIVGGVLAALICKPLLALFQKRGRTAG